LVEKAIGQSEHPHSPREILRTPLHSLLEAIVSVSEELLCPPTVFLTGDIRNEHKEAVEDRSEEGVNPAQHPVGEAEDRCEEESAYDNKEKAPCKAKDKRYRKEHPPPAHSEAKKNPRQVIFPLPCPFPRHNEAPVFVEEVKVVSHKFEEEKKGKPEEHAADKGG
jgi:hypothetical protein